MFYCSIITVTAATLALGASERQHGFASGNDYLVTLSTACKEYSLLLRIYTAIDMRHSL